MVVAAGGFGCDQHAATGDMMPEGMTSKADNSAAVAKVRRSHLRELRTLWARRGASDITIRVLPFLNSPSGAVRQRAVFMLGRLENVRALKPLEAMRSQAPAQSLQSTPEGSPTLFPELPLAVGRIKARRLSGRGKLDTVLSEVGLDWGGLASLSRAINGDKYGWRYLGYRVIEDSIDLLAKEKKRGQDVDALISALTLRPEQKAVLHAVSPSSTIEAERLLDYSARNGATGGQTPFVIEHILDLGVPDVLLGKISVKLRDRNRYPDPDAFLEVLKGLSLQGNKRAFAMLEALAKQDSRREVRDAAKSAIDELAWTK